MNDLNRSYDYLTMWLNGPGTYRMPKNNIIGLFYDMAQMPEGARLYSNVFSGKSKPKSEEKPNWNKEGF